MRSLSHVFVLCVVGAAPACSSEAQGLIEDGPALIRYCEALTPTEDFESVFPRVVDGEPKGRLEASQNVRDCLPNLYFIKAESLATRSVIVRFDAIKDLLGTQYTLFEEPLGPATRAAIAKAVGDRLSGDVVQRSKLSTVSYRLTCEAVCWVFSVVLFGDYVIDSVISVEPLE